VTLFSLNPSSGIPLYRQLFHQLQQRILSGQLATGAQLPSVRDLSSQIHVNPLTVAKVYQLLEQEGFVETRRGLGTFVAHRTPSLSHGARLHYLEPAVRQLVTEALHLGLPEADVLKLVSHLYQQSKPSPGKQS
jgi:GntR family transcriptional regulator